MSYIRVQDDLSGLSLCTTPMCSQGKASVEQMRATFDRLVSQKSIDRSQFEPLVGAIESSFGQNYSRFSEWIPFNPKCCAIADIGRQAEELTSRMLQSVGLQPMPKGPAAQTAPGTSVWSIVIYAGVAVAAAYAWSKFRERR